MLPLFLGALGLTFSSLGMSNETPRLATMVYYQHVSIVFESSKVSQWAYGIKEEILWEDFITEILRQILVVQPSDAADRFGVISSS